MPYMDVGRVRHWFEREKRTLPWREGASPYGVWVSEVMLQQTQASVVVPYFRRWMERFPTIASLAEAPPGEVVKMWEGLGYYSRVRNLHEAAKWIMENGGELPREREALAKVKGIGPYTQGAILSFAFHEKAAAVDGNVLRVMARYFLVEEEIEGAKEKIAALTLSILPDEEPWVVMEGLIELGAQICRKKPLCEECPIQASCLAKQHGKAELLPLRKKRKKTISLERAVAIVFCKDEFLVGKVEGKKVMAGLYEFPYTQIKKPAEATRFVKKMLKQDFEIKATYLKSLDATRHSFTRYSATLYPTIWRAEQKVHVDKYEWINKDQLFSLPFSSGHRKLLNELAHAHIAY